MALALERYTSPLSKSCFPQLLKERTKKEREKSMLIATKKAVDYLPDNLVIEVLSWLPVKALLQFKAVNKSWFVHWDVKQNFFFLVKSGTADEKKLYLIDLVLRTSMNS
ncbi:unnamed protein product [Amaranthus hypochondriacus]